ncbi:MAG TPA: antitoxin family protein [Lacipirellulaceae bacterium]|nr:antitoxin family protein [Lacipirellulaceae bacterium]HMP05429.1 antitoxin family protein [Lacipirellulaceae bacterium]
MTPHIDAIYDHGVLRPIEPLDLPDGARVHLQIVPSRESAGSASESMPAEPSTLAERLQSVIGSIDDLPEDSSSNLDRYLYGRQ